MKTGRKTSLEILSIPKAPKICKNCQVTLRNSKDSNCLSPRLTKRFQRIVTAQVLGQPKDPKGFHKDSNSSSPRPNKQFKRIPKYF